MRPGEIFGEDVDAIGAAMQHFRFGAAGDDGMMTIRATAPIAELAPLFRALMRAEAQMLLSDADDHPTRRSHAGRTASAAATLWSRSLSG